jgi:hypothetical protein
MSWRRSTVIQKLLLVHIPQGALPTKADTIDAIIGLDAVGFFTFEACSIIQSSSAIELRPWQ